MGNAIFELRADGKVSQENISDILLALDRAKSPKIQQLIVDFDEISNAHLLQLINATHQTTLANLRLSFSEMDKSFAQSLYEAAKLNSRIASCWLLLGTNHLYYRDDVIGNLSEVLQLSFPRRVSIECQSMTEAQVVELVQRVNECDIIEELTVNITKMGDDAAEKLAALLNDNLKLTNISLDLNGFKTTIDRRVEEDLIQQFSGLMEGVKADLSEVSEMATGFTSSLLSQGRSLLRAFSAPLTACAQPAQFQDDGLAEELSPQVEEKVALGKYH